MTTGKIRTTNKINSLMSRTTSNTAVCEGVSVCKVADRPYLPSSGSLLEWMGTIQAVPFAYSDAIRRSLTRGLDFRREKSMRVMEIRIYRLQIVGQQAFQCYSDD